MTRRLIPMAIAYDFDGTLAPGNIQENGFIPAIGMKKSEFWSKNASRADKHEADEILSQRLSQLRRMWALLVVGGGAVQPCATSAKKGGKLLTSACLIKALLKAELLSS